MLNINYLGHTFIFYKVDLTCYVDEFICEKCNIIVWCDNFTIKYYYIRPNYHWFSELLELTCDEHVIKNIIE